MIAAHKCKFNGCNQVLVLDGNCKNRRDVCSATEAGFIEYPNLPGKIKSGCQATPIRTSKYCIRHAPRVSIISSPEQSNSSQSGIVRMIVDKKITRKTVYYQVIII